MPPAARRLAVAPGAVGARVELLANAGTPLMPVMKEGVLLSAASWRATAKPWTVSGTAGAV